MAFWLSGYCRGMQSNLKTDLASSHRTQAV